MTTVLSSTPLRLSSLDCGPLAGLYRFDGWDVVEAPPVEIGDTALDVSLALRAQLDLDGAAVVRMPWLVERSAAEAASLVTALTSLLAEPIRVFVNQPGLWRYLGVDPARPLHSSGGTGSQGLHQDFVNASAPPDFVYLYCRQADPYGGGSSLLASTIGVADELSPADRGVLQQRLFRDGRVVNLENIGIDINPFAVLGDERVRYSGKLLDSLDDAVALTALLRLQNRLARRTVEVLLEAGDLLIVDQRKALHGRMPLGSGQEKLPAGSRRLLMHGFGRERPA